MISMELSHNGRTALHSNARGTTRVQQNWINSGYRGARAFRGEIAARSGWRIRSMAPPFRVSYYTMPMVHRNRGSSGLPPNPGAMKEQANPAHQTPAGGFGEPISAWECQPFRRTQRLSRAAALCCRQSNIGRPLPRPGPFARPEGTDAAPPVRRMDCSRSFTPPHPARRTGHVWPPGACGLRNAEQGYQSVVSPLAYTRSMSLGNLAP